MATSVNLDILTDEYVAECKKYRYEDTDDKAMREVLVRHHMLGNAEVENAIRMEALRRFQKNLIEQRQIETESRTYHGGNWLDEWETGRDR